MVAATPAAPQHRPARRTPRPLPLFLDLVRIAGERDPEIARQALAGARVYGEAPRPPAPAREVVAQKGRATLRLYGMSGPPVILVPSLINPSRVLDIDMDRSLLAFLGESGFRAMLLDWGDPTPDEAGLDIAGHVERYLLPLLAAVGEPAHIVGYCLGGTMSVAAATLTPLRSLTLLATPWRFAGYPQTARTELTRLWDGSRQHVAALGMLPMEVLQSAFWGLDPGRTVAKYAALAKRDPTDPDVIRFAALEDWANAGAPLTAAAAADLLDAFVQHDRPGAGRWRVGDRIIDPAALTIPAHQFTAANDRIAPAETATGAIRVTPCPSGHVGMIVGSRARQGCWIPLLDWLRSQ